MISLYNDARFILVPIHPVYHAGQPMQVAVLMLLDGYDVTTFGCPPVTTPGILLGMNSCHHDNYHGSLACLGLVTNSKGQYVIQGNTFDRVVIGPGHYDLTEALFVMAGITRASLVYDVTLTSVTVTYSYGDTRKGSSFAFTDVNVWRFQDLNNQYMRYRVGTASAWKQVSKIEFPYVPIPKVVAYNSGVYSTSTILHATQPNDSASHILEMLNQRFLMLFPYYWDDEIWGDLSQQSCDNVKLLDMNTIAYIGDLIKLKELVVDVIGLLRGKVNLKTLADAFLTVKYAILTFIDDTKGIAAVPSKLKKHQFKNCDSTRSTVSFTKRDTLILLPLTWNTSFHQKIWYLHDDPTWVGMIRLALTTGLFPSLSNVWDFIPFSFVVNWFVDIGGLLDRVDTNTMLSTLPIIAAAQTRCDKTSVDAFALPELKARSLQGLITYQRYMRDIVGQVKPPMFRIDAKTISVKDHWVEAAALIIQRHK